MRTSTAFIRWVAVGYIIAIVAVLPWQPDNTPMSAYGLIVLITLTFGFFGSAIVAIRNYRKGI